jgi:uncharacterized protein YjiS (DUF1127 family)
MISHSVSQPKLDQAARRVPGILLDRSLKRLMAVLDEWRTRREIERELGSLPNFHMRDIGLTKTVIEAACADSFDRSACRALKRAAQDRAGNW